MTPLHTAFQAAYDIYLAKKAEGIDAKKPKMYFPDFHITKAPPNKANAGYLYVKDNTPYPDTVYLGKIAPDGQFSSTVQDKDELNALSNIIELACATPLDLLQEIGKETGTCCCCGRHLTNPLSVKLGIGPICRGGWFPDASLEETVGLTSAEDVPHITDFTGTLPEVKQGVLVDMGLVKKEPDTIFVAVDHVLDQYLDLSDADRIVFLSRLALKEATRS